MKAKNVPRSLDDGSNKVLDRYFCFECSLDLGSFWGRFWCRLWVPDGPPGDRQTVLVGPWLGPGHRLVSMMFWSCCLGSLLEPSWAPLLVVLRRPWPLFGSSWDILGPFWQFFVPIFCSPGSFGALDDFLFRFLTALLFACSLFPFAVAHCSPIQFSTLPFLLSTRPGGLRPARLNLTHL